MAEVTNELIDEVTRLHAAIPVVALALSGLLARGAATAGTGLPASGAARSIRAGWTEVNGNLVLLRVERELGLR